MVFAGPEDGGPRRPDRLDRGAASCTACTLCPGDVSAGKMGIESRPLVQFFHPPSLDNTDLYEPAYVQRSPAASHWSILP